jgi:hypothetical protein
VKERTGRNLQVGDEALTDYSGNGMTLVVITERFTGTKSQSGICFRVKPPLEKYDPFAMFDADWFEPAPKDLL